MGVGRRWLAAVLVCGLASWTAQAGDSPSPAAATVLNQWSAKHFVMLYRKETDGAPGRLDPTIQATSLALEHEFLNRQYQIAQPSAEALRAMDQGPGVVVTFAPDAGMSMIYSVYSSMRPQPGTDVGIAEVRIEARVFVGATLLSAETGRGQIQTRTDAAYQGYGERRGYEIAAQQAATELAEHVDARLKTLSPEQIVEMVADDPTTSTSFVLVEPPASVGATDGAAAAPSASGSVGTPPAMASNAPPGPAAAPAPVAVPSGPAPVAQPTSTVPSAAAPAAQPTVTVPPSSASDSPAPPAIAKRWLLTIGVSDYSKAVGIVGQGTHDNDLEGTSTDVRNVQATFKTFGFEDSTTTKLFDATATVGSVRAALDSLARSVGPDDAVVLYLSGHGMQKQFGRTGMTLPVFYDTDVHAGPGTGLDFEELVHLFARIPARQLVMLLDTCHSGGAATEFATVSISSRGVEASHSSGAPDLKQIMKGVKASRGDIAVMSAAKTDETAIDLGSKDGGLFTSSLLKGLKETQGTSPLQDVYTSYVLPPVFTFCSKPIPGVPPCQQTPVLGYEGDGNMIRLAGAGAKAINGRGVASNARSSQEKSSR